MFGCDHIFLNKITLDHVKFGKGLIDHPQSVRRRDHQVVKTLVVGSEQDRQNQLTNHEKQENWQSYQNSEEKKTGEEVAYIPRLSFFPEFFLISSVFMFFMIFQLIPFVILSPTICDFHDQKVSPLPGRFRHYMITTEHWYMPLLKLAQKCRIVFSLTWVYLEI